MFLPGNARVKDCLEQHRLKDDFSAECRDELESMMAERATDVRLDSNLRSACEEDITRTCGYEDVSECTFLHYNVVVTDKLMRMQRI